MRQLLSSLGPVCAVIGAQWGDEGKGKVIDILAEHFDVIARACGGANAGHTIVVGGKKHVFHLLPAGSLHAKKPVVLGAGMVIHLPTLLEEIRTLEEAGIEIVHRLHISHAAHIVFDFHKEIDATLEAWRAEKKGKGIGTTKRGIGPAYMDKAGRMGARMAILREWTEKEMKSEMTSRAELVQRMFGVALNVDHEIDQLTTTKKKIGDRVTDAVQFLHAELQEQRTILIEGAQATLLDIDHGTYPFVTSSATTAAGALQGLGLPPHCLTSCIGVAKSYCTRVGEGTFATEVSGAVGDRLRERGGEYGATTGRPRRCGWLHLPDLQYAATINGFTHWNITKVDVLDEEEVIPVGIRHDGTKILYKEFRGWKASTKGITSFNKLPTEAQEFLQFIERETKIPVSLVGTGQGRGEMIVRESGM